MFKVLFVALIAAVGFISCGDDVDCADQAAVEEAYVPQLNAYNAAVTAYNAEQSSENCNTLSDAASDYVDALNDVLDCADVLGGADAINDNITAAEAVIDQLNC